MPVRRTRRAAPLQDHRSLYSHPNSSFERRPALQLARGTRLGPYEIFGLVGAGGMGEVYRASDTRLGRDVAVKILPKDLVGHRDRLNRFEQEARLASSLNNPNVLALYDVGSQDGVPYLVTELLEGASLRDLLKAGPLPLGKAVEVARQIAGGLDAAHAKGVVHRDLKPGNVFVTREGLVKILDFGLAKLTQPEPRDAEQSAVATATAEGHVVGTLGYMAPEQVRGLAVDVRADIFAFGTVLYEMLSGRRAFAGATAADTMSAILTKDPEDLSGPGLSIPPGLERIVRRCLEKDPEKRFQSARDLAFALDAGAAPERSVPASARHRRRRAGVVGLVALVGLVAVAAVSLRLTAAAPRITSIRQVTHDGTLKFGSLVTDGTRVYYTSPSDSSTRLMQAPVTGGDSVPLELSCRGPFIFDILASRGELIVGSELGASSGPLWLAPTTGGSVRPLGDIEVSWPRGFSATGSADGQQIVFASGPDLFVAHGDGSGARRLLTAPGNVLNLRLSPDGRRVRYADGNTTAWEASTDGGDPHPLFPGWHFGNGTWTPDGRYYLFDAARDNEAALWAQREKGRWSWNTRPSQPWKLTTGPMHYTDLTLSPDGRTIFALGQPPGTGGELVRYDSATASFVPFLGGHQAADLEFSRDGRWIAYVRLSDVTTVANGTLWRSRPDGTELRQLTFPPENALLPRWSPDGQTIAYMSWPGSAPDAKTQTRVVGAEGGKSRAVRDGVVDPTWSPDGTRLLVGGLPVDSAARRALMIQVVEVATGKASVVPGSEGLFSPRWSPDGRSIAALSTDQSRLVVYSFATAQWRDLLTGFVSSPNWSQDSRYVLLMNQESIVRVRVADGHVDKVANHPAKPVLGWLGITPDDSPLLLQDLNAPPEVYALDVEWP